MEGTRSKGNSKRSGAEGSTNSDRTVYSAQSNDVQTYIGVGKLNGWPVKVLQDTGCTGMTVDRALVPDVMVIPGSSDPVIIGNVRAARRMLPDPDWKAEDQLGVRIRTSGGSNDKNNDDTQGDIPAWMFKKSNQEKTEKSAPKRRDSKRKPAQLKENEDRARRV